MSRPKEIVAMLQYDLNWRGDLPWEAMEESFTGAIIEIRRLRERVKYLDELVDKERAINEYNRDGVIINKRRVEQLELQNAELKRQLGAPQPAMRDGSHVIIDGVHYTIKRLGDDE